MNVSKRNPGPFAAIGLFAALAFAVALVVAMTADASWVYGESSLHNLVTSDVELTEQLLYYGCIVGGILMIVFGAGKAFCECGGNCASGLMIAFSGLFLLISAIMGTDLGDDTHAILEILVYLFLFLAMVLSMFGDWNSGARLSAAIYGILVLIVIGSAIGMNEAKWETVLVACGIMWAIANSTKMVFDCRKA